MHIPRDIMQIKQNIKQFSASESWDRKLYDGGNGCCLTFAKIWARLYVCNNKLWDALTEVALSNINTHNDNETDDRAKKKDVKGTVRQICNITNDRSEEEIRVLKERFERLNMQQKHFFNKLRLGEQNPRSQNLCVVTWWGVGLICYSRPRLFKSTNIFTIRGLRLAPNAESNSKLLFSTPPSYFLAS